MLHHVSFSARQPEVVAKGLAKLLECSALRAPCPPFPSGSWFVCLGDVHGTMLEVLPWSYVQDKQTGLRRISDELMGAGTSSHLLIQSPLSASEIAACASELGWSAHAASTGLFEFTKIWVENTFLIELMTAEQAEDYIANFGAFGIRTLDDTLRAVERAMQKKLA
jgi:hypothetical protein